MVFIDIHFTLALLWHILTRGYNLWPGFTTQAPCMQLLVGSLTQVLLVDMSYLTYLWFQCLPSESKYSELLSFLVKSNAISSAYTGVVKLLLFKCAYISKTGPNFAVCWRKCV